MELYSTEDMELVSEKLDDIIDSIEEKKLEIFEPTKKEIMGTNKIVMDYIREKKRKIYGGYAQNKAIEIKNPKDVFYGPNKIPDIDFYSPEPLQDLIEISDRLYKEGYKFIEGKEAQHKETYSIFVNFNNVADISYVPRNIYNKIPFIEVDGIHYTNPSFMYIDLYRMMTEPYFSASFRWKKIFPRLHKLQKYYPFNKVTKKLPDAYKIDDKHKKIVEDINKTIIDYITNNDSFIVVGQYAYNIYLKESGILKDKNLSKNYKEIEIPFMQLISTHYIKDTATIILMLKDKYGDSKITFTEFYPLWMFTGYNTVIYYEDTPILHITSHNDRCTPYQKINLNKNDVIYIGSYDFVLLMNLIAGLRARVNNLEEKSHYHNIMTSHLVEMRNYYLKNNNKHLLDDTLFQSFVVKCLGYAIDPAREARLSRTEKFQKGKMALFKYYPQNKRDAPDYKFSNTSGNPIQKYVNLKVTKYVNNPGMIQKLDDIELEESINDDTDMEMLNSEEN